VPSLLRAAVIVQPETIVRWHRAGFRLYWRWKSPRPRRSLRSRRHRRLTAMGIRDHPIAARSSWQNGYADRLIGSIRRECLDHIVVFGEDHLRCIFAACTDYYNNARLPGTSADPCTMV
jgi:transposase InsO family protein